MSKRLLPLFICTALLLNACGQKGPLYLPKGYGKTEQTSSTTTDSE